MLKIASPKLTKSQLMKVLEGSPADILEVIKEHGRIRQFDATVWVSLIGGIAGAVSALISGLVKHAEDKSVKKIIVVAGERRIEVPVGTSPELVKEYLNAVDGHDVNEIILK